MTDREKFAFSLWSIVEKRKGYRWPGVVVSRFHTVEGKARYVVECREPAVKGALHIFSDADLYSIRKIRKR